jgi:hypothetical protein
MTRMRAHFTDAELVELGLIAGAFIMLGRLPRAFGGRRWARVATTCSPASRC